MTLHVDKLNNDNSNRFETQNLRNTQNRLLNKKSSDQVVLNKAKHKHKYKHRNTKMQNMINDLHVLNTEFRQGEMISSLIKKEISHTSEYKKKKIKNDKDSVSLGFKTEFKSNRLQELSPSKSFNDEEDTLELSKNPSHVKDMMNSTHTFNYVNDFTFQNLAMQSSKRDLNGRLDNYRTLRAPDRSMNTSQNSSAFSDCETIYYSASPLEKDKINK